ncbi:MAG: PGPGW domain-containing protein [Deltaproteobacteria bacterium]|nr:PGPGW domain-containing protein [Deltaproteobacteria bacterium]
MKSFINNTVNGALRHTKRVVISVVGFTVLFIGIAMIVLPGPAFILIPLGLAILAGEFVWAKNLLERVKSKVKNTKDSIYKKNKTEVTDEPGSISKE